MPKPTVICSFHDNVGSISSRRTFAITKRADQSLSFSRNTVHVWPSSFKPWINTRINYHRTRPTGDLPIPFPRLQGRKVVSLQVRARKALCLKFSPHWGCGLMHVAKRCSSLRIQGCRIRSCHWVISLLSVCVHPWPHFLKGLARSGQLKKFDDSIHLNASSAEAFVVTAYMHTNQNP
jgi:hypothetical protein